MKLIVSLLRRYLHRWDRINSGPHGAHQYFRIITFWNHIEVWEGGEHHHYKDIEEWEALR